MNKSRLVLAGVALAGLGACSGGGVELNVSTVDNSVNNSVNQGGGGANNPCASYTVPNTAQLRQGTQAGADCIYSANFVGVNNPLLTDLTIPFITGVHIFQDSLFVGQNVNTGRAPQEGEGPTLTIEAGNTITFLDSADYILVNRGSKIVANGTASAPIIFTGYTDAVTKTAGPFDVQLWGGLVINGNGITNNCTDAQRANNGCHVVSEGQPSHYGGNNNAESSGSLRYVIVKHAGFEVAPDDELNGITFNAVGSGTVVENIQVYSAYDDGLEFFGGAVNVSNALLLYVRDDSLDFSDGYVGTVDTALAIHAADNGNWCIELDNIGASRSNAGQPFDLAPVTVATVRNYTCIVSNMLQSQGGTHGDSAGFRIRQGGRAQIGNSIVYSGYANRILGKVGNANNRCHRVESPTGLTDAQNGLTTIRDSVLACEVVASGAFANGDTFVSWLSGANPSAAGLNYGFNSGNTLITNVASASLSLLEEGTFYTRTAPTDAAGNPIAIPPGGLGGVLRSDDWTFPWAYGLRAGNRGVALWFE
ncbi:MAG: hypothetical protein KF822_08000 [Steroidobacteraceae bacterium]|nr:hypothetical protein [Steroidobacteraceae bacterium]